MHASLRQLFLIYFDVYDYFTTSIWKPSSIHTGGFFFGYCSFFLTAKHKKNFSEFAFDISKLKRCIRTEDAWNFVPFEGGMSMENALPCNGLAFIDSTVCACARNFAQEV